MIGRVSTFAMGQTVLRSALSVQADYATASIQKSSGLKASTYGELGSQASSLISTEAAATQLTTWKTNTGTANDRTQAMYSAVGDMIDQLTTLRTTLSAVKSSSSSSVDLNQTGKDLLADLADQMNTRMDGRYLFAGGNTDTAPVDTSLLALPNSPSTADTSYYTGDSEVASVRVSSQQTISYGVTADGAAFEKALRSANILANMNTSPIDQDTINEVYDLATEALDGLIAVQSRLSNSSARLEAAETRQTSSLDLLDSMASDLKEVDVASISVKLAQYETQLQASYSALGSLSKFSLTNYL